MMKLLGTAALLVTLVLSLVSLSTRSGYVVFLERPVPLRMALATTPVGLLWNRLGTEADARLQRRIEAYPAHRVGLDDRSDLLLSDAGLLGSVFGLLILCRKRKT